LIVALLMIAGLALVTLGAGMVYEPAGFIVAGSMLILAAWLYVRGGRVTS
jgi:hypothetical protein